MVDISSMIDGKKREEISDVVFIETPYNPAHAFANFGKCEALIHILRE